MNATESDLPKLTLQILQALERKPMTIENLAYGFEIVIEEMRVIVERLLNDGYIDTTGKHRSNGGISLATVAGIAAVGSFIGGPLGAGLGGFIGSAVTGAIFGQSRSEIHNTSTYFTITPKGHFYLHPVTSTSEGTK